MSLRYGSRSRPGTMVSTWLNGLVSGTVIVPGWTALQSATPSSADVTFTSAGSAAAWSGFQDLVIVGYWQSAGGSTSSTVSVTFNNDTGGNYAVQYAQADGSSVTASVDASATAVPAAFLPQAGAGADKFGAGIISIFDINDTAKYTSAMPEGAGDMSGSGQVNMNFTTWKDTTAVTEIDLVTTSGFSAGTRIDLFGVSA